MADGVVTPQENENNGLAGLTAQSGPIDRTWVFGQLANPEKRSPATGVEASGASVLRLGGGLGHQGGYIEPARNATPAVANSDGLIARFPKNRFEECRITLSAFKGVNVVDVRVFADVQSDGVKRPTKKGVSLQLHQLGDLIRGLRAAEKEVRRLGLLKG